MTKYIYSDENITLAVKASTSMAQVMRQLGMKLTGGSQAHLTRRVRALELDTSHFLGAGWSKGQPARNRLTTTEILVILPQGSRRPKTHQLKRAMLDSGLTYCCSECKLEEWMGQPINLDIDHIDGDWLNNLLENLRFRCPNCHRQTDTFGNKKR